MPQLLDKLKNLGLRVAGQPARDGQPALPFPDTLSIESSYACNLKCFMCPRHFDESLQGMFPLDLFKEKVLPVLNKFKYVHLTGWGEPTMNKNFVELLQLCKAQGVYTCFTTNGLLLKEPLSRRILETGVDMILISCDASNPDTYEQVRGKGTFDHLMKRHEHMMDLRREMGVDTKLEWTYVMMQSNLEELPGAVKLAVERGFDRFNAKHMETAINREDLAQALWDTGMATPPDADTMRRYHEIVAECRAIADGSNTELVVHPLRWVRDGQCLVRPVNNIFIDYKGYVSSCCYLNKLDVKPYLDPAEVPADDGVMGDLHLADFIDILESDRFRGFREEWARGEVPEACRNCVNIARMHAPGE